MHPLIFPYVALKQKRSRIPEICTIAQECRSCDGNSVDVTV